MLMMVGLAAPIDLTADILVALPIVIVTTLIMLAGRNAQSNVNPTLSHGPVVFVGLIISYSLYLWHWPAIAL